MEKGFAIWRPVLLKHLTQTYLLLMKGVVQYQVRSVCCTEFEDTWETIDYLDNCPDKLKEFRQKFPRKPRDEREV